MRRKFVAHPSCTVQASANVEDSLGLSKKEIATGAYYYIMEVAQSNDDITTEEAAKAGLKLYIKDLQSEGTNVDQSLADELLGIFVEVANNEFN